MCIYNTYRMNELEHAIVGGLLGLRVPKLPKASGTTPSGRARIAKRQAKKVTAKRTVASFTKMT